VEVKAQPNAKRHKAAGGAKGLRGATKGRPQKPVKDLTDRGIRARNATRKQMGLPPISKHGLSMDYFVVSKSDDADGRKLSIRLAPHRSKRAAQLQRHTMAKATREDRIAKGLPVHGGRRPGAGRPAHEFAEIPEQKQVESFVVKPRGIRVARANLKERLQSAYTMLTASPADGVRRRLVNICYVLQYWRYMALYIAGKDLLAALESEKGTRNMHRADEAVFGRNQAAGVLMKFAANPQSAHRQVSLDLDAFVESLDEDMFDASVDSSSTVCDEKSAVILIEQAGELHTAQHPDVDDEAEDDAEQSDESVDFESDGAEAAGDADSDGPEPMDAEDRVAVSHD